VSDVMAAIPDARAAWAELSNANRADIGQTPPPPEAWVRALSKQKARRVLGMIDGSEELDTNRVKSAGKAIRKAL
jgi:hypothetical protein